MQYIEYGKGNSETLILLHGGGLSWWNYKCVAELLKNDFHVILPILDGHAGSDKHFTTIENNAIEIINYIDTYLQGSVLLITGLSLGGQILLEILSQRKNICKYALIESALVRPSKFTHIMIKPAFGSCYGVIKYKWFSKIQFKSLRINPDLFDNYYRDTVSILKKDMISFLQANCLYSLKETVKESTADVYIFVGEKEKASMLKSAGDIQKAIPHSFLTIIPGLSHGEFSLNYPSAYSDKIIEIIKG